MAHYNTVFHTLAKILPRHEIDRLDRKYGQGDKRRKSSRYVLFIVMLIAQILGLKSLREIEQAQKIKQKRLCHLGVKSPVSRSALSRMNDERSADFFKDVFQQMLQSCKALALGSQFKLPHISPKDQHEYHFITNAMHLSAQTIADVYKERWQIELFFKWVKQNLKIKTFLGTSANAVMTQVWIALCLYLILAFLRFISKTVHSMREILNWIRINLFSNDILDDYLVPKMTEAIVNPPLALF